MYDCRFGEMVLVNAKTNCQKFTKVECRSRKKKMYRISRGGREPSPRPPYRIQNKTDNHQKQNSKNRLSSMGDYLGWINKKKISEWRKYILTKIEKRKTSKETGLRALVREKMTFLFQDERSYMRNVCKAIMSQLVENLVFIWIEILTMYVTIIFFRK